MNNKAMPNKLNHQKCMACLYYKEGMFYTLGLFRTMGRKTASYETQNVQKMEIVISFSQDLLLAITT